MPRPVTSITTATANRRHPQLEFSADLHLSQHRTPPDESRLLVVPPGLRLRTSHALGFCFPDVDGDADLDIASGPFVYINPGPPSAARGPRSPCRTASMRLRPSTWTGTTWPISWPRKRTRPPIATTSSGSRRRMSAGRSGPHPSSSATSRVAIIRRVSRATVSELIAGGRRRLQSRQCRASTTSRCRRRTPPRGAGRVHSWPQRF